MRPTLIDLNDVELRIARGTDELLRSPGYATYAGQKVEVGDAGFSLAWLHPRASSNRFWQALDTAPLTTMGKRVRHAGDLAYLHLEHLRERAGRPDRALFLVPGGYQRAQLSLLLGIAQAVGIAVDALVDSAVAAGATLPPGQYTHVEVLMYRTVVSRLSIDAHRATRIAHEVVPDLGHAQFERRVVGCIVDAFLRGSRFDPLHDAATEQQLHVQLAQWLAQLADRPEIALSMEHHGVRHEARIRRDTLVAAVAPLHARLAGVVGRGSVLLDYRFARLPGIPEAWPGATPLPPHAALTGCALSPDLQDISGEGVALRTELAVVPDTARLPAAPAPRTATRGATHLLCQHVAYPLAPAPLHLTTRGIQRVATGDAIARALGDADGAWLEVSPGATVLLNGTAVRDRAPLHPGDHVTVAGATTLFVPIVVQDRDAN